MHVDESFSNVLFIQTDNNGQLDPQLSYIYLLLWSVSFTSWSPSTGTAWKYSYHSCYVFTDKLSPLYTHTYRYMYVCIHTHTHSQKITLGYSEIWCNDFQILRVWRNIYGTLLFGCNNFYSLNIYLSVLKFSNIANWPLNEILFIKCIFMWFFLLIKTLPVLVITIYYLYHKYYIFCDYRPIILSKNNKD